MKVTATLGDLFTTAAGAHEPLRLPDSRASRERVQPPAHPGCDVEFDVPLGPPLAVAAWLAGAATIVTKAATEAQRMRRTSFSSCFSCDGAGAHHDEPPGGGDSFDDNGRGARSKLQSKCASLSRVPESGVALGGPRETYRAPDSRRGCGCGSPRPAPAREQVEETASSGTPWGPGAAIAAHTRRSGAAFTKACAMAVASRRWAARPRVAVGARNLDPWRP